MDIDRADSAPIKSVTLSMPYIAGYLAFREAPALLDLVTHLKETRPELFPQVGHQ